MIRKDQELQAGAGGGRRDLFGGAQAIGSIGVNV